MSPAILGLAVPFACAMLVAGMALGRWQVTKRPQDIGLRRFNDDEHDETVVRHITARLAAISEEEFRLTNQLWEVTERIKARGQ